MKTIINYIYESSDKVTSENELFELIQVDRQYQGSRGSHMCGSTTLYDIDLQYYNKKWIYNYSIYWRNKFDWPIIGLHGDGKGHYKAFVMNNKEDLKKFGNAGMSEDDSIFDTDIKKEIHKAKRDDYQSTKKELDSYVNSHKEVYQATVGDYKGEDNFTTWSYK